MKRTVWDRQDETAFYAGLPYGGPEWDFGCWWTDEHGQGKWRVSWMPESGDWYATNRCRDVAEYVWIGRSTPRDEKLALAVAEGYGELCQDGASWTVIARRLGGDQVYADQEKATRAYGHKTGVSGNGGGWLYRAGNRRPFAQGWWNWSRQLWAADRIVPRCGGWIVTADRRTVRVEVEHQVAV